MTIEFDQYIKAQYPRDYAALTARYPGQGMSELYPSEYAVWEHLQAQCQTKQAELDALKKQAIDRGQRFNEMVQKVRDLEYRMKQLQGGRHES